MVNRHLLFHSLISGLPYLYDYLCVHIVLYSSFLQKHTHRMSHILHSWWRLLDVSGKLGLLAVSAQASNASNAWFPVRECAKIRSILNILSKSTQLSIQHANWLLAAGILTIFTYLDLSWLDTITLQPSTVMECSPVAFAAEKNPLMLG